MKFNRISKPNTTRKIYRYFKDEFYAEQFLRGKFRISTLKRCREHENPLQGDKYEANFVYDSGFVSGTDKDPIVIETAKRLGFDTSFGNGNSHFSFIGCKGITGLYDAYVFCTSTLFDPVYFEKDFGPYCVEIIDPGFFGQKVSETIHLISPLECSTAGKIKYKNRHYTGLETHPTGEPEFIKPHIYSPQNEYRFVWYPVQANKIDYLDIECNKIRGLLKRLS